MTEFIVTSTAKEHSDYLKKKAREQMRNDLIIVAISLVCFAALYYALWGTVVH